MNGCITVRVSEHHDDAPLMAEALPLLWTCSLGSQEGRQDNCQFDNRAIHYGQDSAELGSVHGRGVGGR